MYDIPEDHLQERNNDGRKEGIGEMSFEIIITYSDNHPLSFTAKKVVKK